MKPSRFGLAVAAIAAMAFSAASYAGGQSAPNVCASSPMLPGHNTILVPIPGYNVDAQDARTVALHFTITDVNGKAHELSMSARSGTSTEWMNMQDRRIVSGVSASVADSGMVLPGVRGSTDIDSLAMGLRVSARPEILPNGDISVRVVVRDRELIALHDYPTAAGPLQLPETRVGSFEGDVVVKPAKDLVLTQSHDDAGAPLKVSLSANVEKGEDGAVASR